MVREAIIDWDEVMQANRLFRSYEEIGDAVRQLREYNRLAELRGQELTIVIVCKS